MYIVSTHQSVAGFMGSTSHWKNKHGRYNEWILKSYWETITQEQELRHCLQVAIYTAIPKDVPSQFLLSANLLCLSIGKHFILGNFSLFLDLQSLNCAQITRRGKLFVCRLWLNVLIWSFVLIGKRNDSIENLFLQCHESHFILLLK